MVPNGKAELVANATQALKIRKERVELMKVVGMAVSCLVLCWQLYSNMGDGWQRHARTRSHVLMLAGSLLALSTVACCYLCRRLATAPTPAAPRTLMSFNSELQLICRDRPPSYEAVVNHAEPPAPPSYSTVFMV